MSCITQGGIRCNKCCEVIHVAGTYRKGLKESKYNCCAFVNKHWVSISKRRAKKVNPYMFTVKATKAWRATALYFRCKALQNGVCTEYEDRPNVCQLYKGGDEYSPTCEADVNIIARG